MLAATMRRADRSPELSVCLIFHRLFNSIAPFPQAEHPNMARVCQITGKKPMVGHNVSHANNKTKRRFLPNLQYHRFWVESQNCWIRLRVSSAGLRTIDKYGIDHVLADLRAKAAAARATA